MSLFMIVVDGAWGSWGNWSQCNITCGDPNTTGKMSRERLCNNPVPTGNGQDCVGYDKQEEPCTSMAACSSEFLYIIVPTS